MSRPIIIGAGHNGLVCAAYLAKAGLRPLVLEARDEVGGCAVTHEIAPGVRVPALTHTVALRADIVRDLGLDAQGLSLTTPAVSVCVPTSDGRALVLPRDTAAAARALAPWSARDAERWPAFVATHAGADTSDGRCAGTRAPVDRRAVGERAVGSAARGTQATRPGPPTACTTCCAGDRCPSATWPPSGSRRPRFVPRSARVASLACRPARDRPGRRRRGCCRPRRKATPPARSPLSTAVPDRPVGGACRGGHRRRRGDSPHRAGRAHRRSTTPACARSCSTRVSASRQRAVISGADPKHTFLQLVDPVHLQPSFRQQVLNYRANGVVAKVNLVVTGLPAVAGLDTTGMPAEQALAGRLLVGDEPDEFERAFDCTKYGRMSDRPWLEVSVPSLNRRHAGTGRTARALDLRAIRAVPAARRGLGVQPRGSLATWWSPGWPR